MAISTASKAFGKQSVIFDQIYDSNPIVSYMRSVVRKIVLSNIFPKGHILEVNAGTATDAVFFAQQGFQVSAFDVSSGMVSKSNEKIETLGLTDKITFNELNYEKIDQINETFDYVYSNFGGLNCTSDLTSVVNKLADRLKPGGGATFVIMPPFTLWEKVYYLKGNLKVATRRKRTGPSDAYIEGEQFNCWYYQPDVVSKALEGRISNLDIRGLCIISPPSFLDWFPRKFPRLYKLMIKIDKIIAGWPIFNFLGDYYIYTFTKL